MKTLPTILLVAFFCLVMIVLGGTIFSVMVEYPNWFANVPASLEATRTFYKVLHPGYFFQTLGPLLVLSGIAFVIAGWRTGSARNLVALAVAIFIAIELLTFLYIYPRLDIMFGPNAASQSIDALQLAASEFTLADRVRTLMCIIAAGTAVAALLRYFKFLYGSRA